MKKNAKLKKLFIKIIKRKKYKKILKNKIIKNAII